MARLDKTSGQAAPAQVDGAGVSLDEPLLNCQAAAALLNVRVSWVRDAARRGHLPCLRVGRHLRFTRVMLEAWLAEQVERPSRDGRVLAGPTAGPGGRSPRGAPGAHRRRTQAALLASLAENPRSKEIEDDR
ncbi:MAG: helix-turn-helix domain-containing protein [Solirubrobacteraceae bacterium]|jgi:excisionase family DNA binding protein